MGVDKKQFQCEILWCVMVKNMVHLSLQPIHYKQTVEARSLWLGWHVQGVGCARGRLHNPRIGEFSGGCYMGMGHTFGACERFGS